MEEFEIFVCPDCEYIGETWIEIGYIPVTYWINTDDSVEDSYYDYDSYYPERFECPECSANYDLQEVAVSYKNGKLTFNDSIWDKNELLFVLYKEGYIDMELFGENPLMETIPKYNLNKYVWK